MTAQGSPLTRYRRAIESRSVILAELSAREAGFLPLPDALGLVALYAEAGDPKYERAATRWLARFALEKRDVRLGDVQLAAAALGAMPERGDAALRVLAELSGQPEKWASARRPQS